MALSEMDAGFQAIMALEEHPLKATEYCRDLKKFQQLIQSLPEEERLERRMLQSVWGKSFGKLRRHPVGLPLESPDLRKSGQCPACWLYPRYCSCTAVSSIKTPLPINLVLYMHYNEFRSASNTVKILSRSLPSDCCRTLLFAHPGR